MGETQLCTTDADCPADDICSALTRACGPAPVRPMRDAGPGTGLPGRDAGTGFPGRDGGIAFPGH
jgi:hypothetical protein